MMNFLYLSNNFLDASGVSGRMPEYSSGGYRTTDDIVRLIIGTKLCLNSMAQTQNFLDLCQSYPQRAHHLLHSDFETIEINTPYRPGAELSNVSPILTALSRINHYFDNPYSSRKPPTPAIPIKKLIVNNSDFSIESREIGIPKGIDSLIQLIGDCNVLEALNLSGGNINDTQVGEIIAKIPKTLKFLILVGNPIKAKGCEILRVKTEELPNLKVAIDGFFISNGQVTPKEPM